MNTTFNYLLSAKDIEQVLPLNMDFLHGVYSAQLLIDAEQKTNRVNLLSELGQMQAVMDYGYTLNRVDNVVDEVKMAKVPVVTKPSDPSTIGGSFRLIPYIDPLDVPTAYNKALSNALSFSTLGLDISRIEYDVTKTPYHVIGHFDTPSSNRLLVDSFDTFLYKNVDFTHAEEPGFQPQIDKARFDSVFSLTADNDPSRYYIGSTPDGRNTFMVKAIANDMSMFLRGFFAFFKWIAETGAENNPRLRKFGSETELIPELYLYDYGREVVLRNTSNVKDMESQIRATSTRLETRY